MTILVDRNAGINFEDPELSMRIIHEQHMTLSLGSWSESTGKIRFFLRQEAVALAHH